MATPIHHLARAADWQRARETGIYTGSAEDRADGFLHFSTSAQIRGSAAKHRAGEADLVLLTVAADSLGPELRWEESRNGALFPHLYGTLDIRLVARADPLPLDDGGAHVFPDGLDLP